MSNTDQIDYWNGDAGHKWVTYSDQLDTMLAPFADRVLDIAKLQPGERVMDIGCGAGALSLKVADQIGDTGRVIGVDVSEPMIELARQRAQAAGSPISFITQDASTHRMDQPVDAILSRFGVMFFEDPGQAFASMRGNLKPGGRMVFACWQAMVENDWGRVPLEVTLPFLKEPPVMPPEGAPGAFAFADKDRVAGLLEAAGWQDVSIENWVCQLDMPGRNPDESAAFMLQIGPMAQLLEAQEIPQGPVENALSARLSELAGNDGPVRMKGASWIVSAKA